MKLFFLTAALMAALTSKDVDPKAAAAAASAAADKGLRWLASSQGRNGGWGQDGGETSYIRQADRQETNGHDVANTAVAALALWRSGNADYRPNVEKALDFVAKSVEESAMEGLAVTSVTGSQIQRAPGLASLMRATTSRITSACSGSAM